MAEQAKPRISNVTKFFIPGLALGLLVGGIGGAYFGPRLDGPSMQEIRPKGPAPTTRATGRPEDAPAVQTPETPTGATGATAATGSTGSAPAPK